MMQRFAFFSCALGHKYREVLFYCHCHCTFSVACRRLYKSVDRSVTHLKSKLKGYKKKVLFTCFLEFNDFSGGLQLPDADSSRMGYFGHPMKSFSQEGVRDSKRFFPFAKKNYKRPCQSFLPFVYPSFRPSRPSSLNE